MSTVSWILKTCSFFILPIYGALSHNTRVFPWITIPTFSTRSLSASLSASVRFFSYLLFCLNFENDDYDTVFKESVENDPVFRTLYKASFPSKDKFVRFLFVYFILDWLKRKFHVWLTLAVFDDLWSMIKIIRKQSHAPIFLWFPGKYDIL